ncbi:MAG: FAD-dependent oxidoreductase [Chloroflexi bacterium]|nr:FAD-dependent oxidoreductase [Chloroflexota bacterium]
MDTNTIRMYGTTWCGDCKRAKKFLGEHRVRYTFVDVDADAEGLRIVEEVNQGKHIIPTIFFPDGSALVEPSNAELAERLGLQTRPRNPFYDLVLVGGGPAALTAALYAAREGIETLVVERSSLGGQAGVTERLDNYPGFPEGISGAEFAERLVQQCRRFGVELLTATEVTGVGVLPEEDEHRFVRTSVGRGGDTVCAWSVLLAPGSTYRRLGLPGEDDFIGAGIHFCATCDGPFYRDQDVLVVGGGNSAAEEGLFLTRFARQVTLIVRGDQLSASKVVADKVLSHRRMAVRFGTAVAGYAGDARLRAVRLRETATGREETVEVPAVFVFIGLRPNTGFLAVSVDLDPSGFILTDPMLQTSVPGIFACGDARLGSTKQLVSAAGEGATAALMIRHYLQTKKVVPDAAARGASIAAG